MKREELRRFAESQRAAHDYMVISPQDLLDLMDDYDRALMLLGQTIRGDHDELVKAVRPAIQESPHK